MYKKSKAQIISDAVCGVLMLVSILFFGLFGLFTNIWHPTWFVVPSSGLVCGIISIIVNTYVSIKSKETVEEKKEEKPAKETKK